MYPSLSAIVPFQGFQALPRGVKLSAKPDVLITVPGGRARSHSPRRRFILDFDIALHRVCLANTLARIPDWKITRVDELLPWNAK